jgi:hypothetical protein
VLLELCQSGGNGRLWVREWAGGAWSGRVPVSPAQADFNPYSFYEIEATDAAVSVAFRVGGHDGPWAVKVVRSTSPGRWPPAVQLVSGQDPTSRPVAFAMRGADAVLVWLRRPAVARPGAVEAPVFARVLRADGRVTSDESIGYGVIVACYSATSGNESVAFVWSMFCRSSFRIASWDGTGAWTRDTLRPRAEGSFAVRAPWSVSAAGRVPVVAWQAAGGVVASAVRP